MFAQGGLCFFCNAQLPKAEASVEHLVPSARAGSNSDDNCVVCCKAINALLGSMSLKEKIRVVLNQNGHFKCPNGKAFASASTPAVPPKSRPAAAISTEAFSAVVENLKARGNARPRRLKTLASTIKAMPKLMLTDAQVQAIIGRLRELGKIVTTNEQVVYKL
jgi:hypothetical protein